MYNGTPTGADGGVEGVKLYRWHIMSCFEPTCLTVLTGFSKVPPPSFRAMSLPRPSTEMLASV